VGKRVTIRDVAEASGLAISSVHFALTGKPGVSEETRERVKQVALELGYRPNPAASSLKQKQKTIAALVLGDTGSNRYFFGPVWQGMRDCVEAEIGNNFRFIEMPYTNAGLPAVADQLLEMVQERTVAGILTVGHIDCFSQSEWDDFHAQGIQVVTMGSKNTKAHTTCCICPDFEIIGRTMAELILDKISPYGSIFICAGNPKWLDHSLIVSGFEAYLKENNATNLIYKNHSWNMDEDNYHDILESLSRPDLAACCSVLAQSSILLGRALEESGRAGKIVAIGSDLIEENADRLKRKVFDNIIQKNPYAQGYLGMKTLIDSLIYGKSPKSDVLYVGSEVVFRSNMPMYEHGGYRNLII
jgi:LacI family transcriptional regulator